MNYDAAYWLGHHLFDGKGHHNYVVGLQIG